MPGAPANDNPWAAGIHSAPSSSTYAAPTVRGALWLAARPWRLGARALAARLDEVLPGSLPLVLVTVAAVGVALCDQAARQALRLLGDQSFIGPEYIVLGAEEFGPVIVALTVAQRVGAGFAAELATLRCEDTLDALTLYGLDLTSRILAPMAVALVCGSVALGLCGFVAWELAGVATMWFRSGISPFTFVQPDALTSGSVLVLVTKCVTSGLLIFVTSARAGLTARGGAEAVGQAATQAVVAGVVACLGATLIIDVVFYAWRHAWSVP